MGLLGATNIMYGQHSYWTTKFNIAAFAALLLTNWHGVVATVTGILET